MTTLKQAESYYRKGAKPIDSVVRRAIVNQDEIVYGARAVNKRLPKHLDIYTEDWDIATTDDPASVAKKIEKKLDKRYGGNFFRVEPAKHAGTYKIKSNVTEKGVVDVTVVEPHTVPHEKIEGVNYATLDYQLMRIDASLDDPKSAFRHKKDLETRQRITIHRKKKSRKRSVGSAGIKGVR